MKNQPLTKTENQLASFFNVKAQILTSKTQEETVKSFTQFQTLLKSIDLEKIEKIQTLLYDVFKPISRQITNSNIKKQQILKLFKRVIIKIIEIECRMFSIFRNINALQVVKELICRQSYLFSTNLKKGAGAVATVDRNNQKENVIEQQQEGKFVWTQGRIGFTVFHKECCQVVMTSFNSLHQKFQSMKLNEIQQLLKFIYFIDDNLFQDKIVEFVISCKQSLEKVYEKPSKQLIKQATRDNLSQISQMLIKLLRYSSNLLLKKKISLLGCYFALNLLKQDNIQKRIAGAKILDKFAYNFYFRNNSYVSEQDFAAWMVEVKIIDILYDIKTQTTLIKATQYVGKLLFGKGKLQEADVNRYLDLVWEVRNDVRGALLKNLDPFRISYVLIGKIIQKYSIIKKPDLYIQEFFTLMENLSRYSLYAQTQRIMELVINITFQNYYKFKDVILRRKCLQAIKYIFEKLVDTNIRDTSDKVNAYMKIIGLFVQNPSHLTLLLARRIFQTQQRRNAFVLQKVAKLLVQKDKIIEVMMNHMEKSVTYKQQLLYFLKQILSKYKKYDQKLTLPEDLMIQATKYPQIFSELIKFYEHSHCQDLFNKLLNLLQERQIDFDCIKFTYYRMNFCNIDILPPQYMRPTQYLVRSNPNNLSHIKDIKKLVFNCKYEKVQQKCAQLLADVYTSFIDSYHQKGIERSKQFMLEIIKICSQIYDSFNKDFLNETQIIGCLYLMSSLMSASQTMGVGTLKSHNSLIATSMSKVKIWNNCSHGDDVQKCYQKTIPSNLTLFEVLTEVGKQFKLGPQDMYLQQGLYTFSAKQNGHTLEELHVNERQFCAYKNSRNKIKAEPLRIQGKLNPKFIKALKEIYKKFSIEGRMGPKQCANYVQGATQTPSSINDNRVIKLFDLYDSDKDGSLTEDDFIRFYQDSSDTPQKQETVWSNLIAFRFRKDLKMYNEELDPIDQTRLFRYYLMKSNQIYEFLFKLCEIQNQKIRQLAKNILIRLPTSHKVLEQTTNNLNFQGKSIFLTKYTLINIQYWFNQSIKQNQNEKETEMKQESQTEQKISQQIINQQKISEKNQKSEQIDNNSKSQKKQSKQRLLTKEQKVQKFIDAKGQIKLFQLIQKIHSKLQFTQQEKEIKVVSIFILRELLNFQNLKDSLQFKQKIPQFKDIELPQTTIFQDMIKFSLLKKDFTIYQSVLALQLTQKTFDKDWIQKGLFNRQKSIRKITSNFLIFWELKSFFEINLFETKIRVIQSRCEEWYQLLNTILRLNKKINLNKIFNQLIALLPDMSEDLEQNAYNPILNGNLLILKTVLQLDSSFIQNNKIYPMLLDLIEKTVSSSNRLIIYSLMSITNPQSTLDYLSALIKNVKPTSQYEVRQNYVGIKNLGSICYMNSILQQFFRITEFKKLIFSQQVPEIYELSKINDIQFYDNFMYQLQKMYAFLQKSKKKCYYPKQFCLSVKDYDGKPINPSLQEDAHQFLNKLFDQVEILLKKKNQLQLLQNIFQGKTITEIICKDCQNKISRIQTFYHLSVQVKDQRCLEDSFKKFIEIEQIPDYFCQKCDKKVNKITKQNFINQCPNILIVNLQRIVFDLNTFLKVKVHSKLQFPQNLDLKEYLHSDSMIETTTYQLKGVVIHTGTSQGGHYYSLIKIQSQWYKFNDHTVTKFNENDLIRQAFGGQQSTDSWGQSSYSTNAYILFYEKCQINKTQEQESVQQSDFNSSLKRIVKNPSLQEQILSSPLFKEVDNQNKLFYKQVQIHQQSFFQFINSLYLTIRPTEKLIVPNSPFIQDWKNLPNLKYYEKLFSIYMDIIHFIPKFYQLKQQTFFNIGGAIFELLSILPQKSYQFLIYLDQKFALETMCAHNEAYIREIFKVVMNKSLFVYLKYYGLKSQDQEESQTQRIKQILEFFLEAASGQIVAKNIFKSFCFFQFWRINIDMDNYFLQFCLQKQYLAILSDLLMANQSPLAKSDVKRQDFPYMMAAPITQSILKLFCRKKNLKDIQHWKFEPQVKLYSLTDKQKLFLQNPKFFKKMMKFKYDNGCLYPLITGLSFKDYDFSVKMTELFLTGLNKLDEVQDANSLLNNIQAFLLLQDQYTQERIKWVLGIPQFQTLKALTYGLRNSNESPYIIYASSRFFIQSQFYKPALQVLFDKRNYFTNFQVQGITTLLNLLATSDRILKYVLQITPPCYQYVCYLDWIQQFVRKIKEQQHYGLQLDKNFLYEKLSTLLIKINQKKQFLQLKSPVQKYIIGKNFTRYAQEKISRQNYDITLWVHQTYVLQNLPTKKQNLSLPDQIFKFTQLKSYAKYFVDNYEGTNKSCDIQIPAEKTVITLEINTKVPLILNFSAPQFSHKIYIQKGQMILNLPFVQKKLQEFLKVQEGQQMKKIQIIQDEKKVGFEQYKQDFQPYKSAYNNDYLELNCPTCTYLNVGRQKCEMCDTDLIK